MTIKKKRKSNNVCFSEAEKGVESFRKTKINLWINSEVHRQLKIDAAKEEITVTSILCKAAEDYLKNRGCI